MSDEPIDYPLTAGGFYTFMGQPVGYFQDQRVWIFCETFKALGLLVSWNRFQGLEGRTLYYIDVYDTWDNASLTLGFDSGQAVVHHRGDDFDYACDLEVLKGAVIALLDLRD